MKEPAELSAGSFGSMTGMQPVCGESPGKAQLQMNLTDSYMVHSMRRKERSNSETAGQKNRRVKGFITGRREKKPAQNVIAAES